MTDEKQQTEIQLKNKITSKKPIKIEEFRKNVRKTKPHKHNKYIELIYFTGGSGHHTIDHQKIEIRSNMLFVVRKDQVHFWDIKSEPSGYVLLLKDDFFEGCTDISIKQLFTKISAYPYLFPKGKKTIKQLFQLLVNENIEDSIDGNLIVEGLLKSLLVKLLQVEEGTKIKHVGYYSKFIDLLYNQNNFHNKVEDYANLLNTTPQNLNASCRKESNQSAYEIISDFIIGEAKRLLIYTDLAISEISYSLLFKDNSHFSKYFKRNVGVTPKEFRQ